MSKRSKKRLSKKQKYLLLVVGAFVAFMLLLYFQEETLIETWHVLRKVQLKYVLLLPCLQIVNYFFIGNYYRKMFALFGGEISVRRSWGVVAAMNFVNQVLPSGGLSGISYLAFGFRAMISTGKATLVQLGRYIYAFWAYTLLLPFAVVLLMSDGRDHNIENATQSVFGNPAIMTTMLLFLLIMIFTIASFSSRAVSRHTGQFFLSLINWVSRSIFRSKRVFQLQFIRNANNELHEGITLIKEKGIRAVLPGGFMLISAFFEIAIVYTATLAVGANISIGAVFLAFTAANIVGVVSIIPGDVGVHEATIVLVLAAFGVDEPVALSAILLYRVYNKLVFLPIGFYFYSTILKPAIELKKQAQNSRAQTDAS